MKRIISTLLSLSLVLSLLPTVALAEGESSGLNIVAPNSLFVGESDYAIAADENYKYVMENVTWTNSGNTIVQVNPITDDEWDNITDKSSVDRSAIVKITAQQAGEAEIQAITDSRKKGTHTITVKNVVPVEKITLDSEMTVTTSGPHELQYTIEPANASIQDLNWKSQGLKWESTDAAVAKVQYSSGRYLLYAYKNGTTTITATANDGSGVTASCEVTVNIKYPVESISLNYDTYTIRDSSKLGLSVIFNPTNATNKIVTWKSSNEAVATVDKSGWVTPVSNGNTTITATTQDGDKTATCEVTVDAAHIHKWSTCLDANRNGHYRVCLNPDCDIDDAGEMEGYGPHDYNADGKCSVCGLGKDGTKVPIADVKMKDFRFAHTGKQIDFLGGDNCDNIVATVGTNIRRVLDTPLQGEIQGCTPQEKGDENRTECGKYSATVKFSTGLYETIAPLYFEIVQVTIDQKTLSFSKVRDPQTLKADVYPQNKGVTWESSDPDVAIVDKNGNVTATGNGNTTITATANDGSGAEASCNVIVNVTNCAENECTFTDWWDSNETDHWLRCDKCGRKKDAGEAHKYGEWQIDDSTHWHECTVCGRRKDEGHHDPGEWKYDTTSHWNVCNVCRVKINEGAHQFGEWIIDKEATTTTPGEKRRICICGYTVTETIPVTPAPHEHQYSDKWSSDATNHWHACECGEKSAQSAHQFKWIIDQEATAATPGEKHQECTTCGYQKAPVTIPVKSAPTVTVKDSTVTVSNKSQTTKLDVKADEDAKLTYKSDNKSVKVDKNGKVTIAKNFVGKATITVTATSGSTKTTKKVTVTVNPKGTTFRSVYNGAGKKLKAYWNRNGQVSGYQLQYGTNKNFTGCKTVTLKSNNYTGSVRTGLKKNATYYVRIRTYKKVSGKTYYSAWSKVKSFKVVR